MPVEQQSSGIDLATWNAAVQAINRPGAVARQRDEVRHYEPLDLAAGAGTSRDELRSTYAWVAETGNIQSYRNKETGKNLHIDADRNFYSQKGQSISREAALTHASTLKHEHSQGVGL